MTEQTLNLETTLQGLSKKIAPLWPLTHFVAVNPFAGFSDQSFATGAAYLKRVQGSDLVLDKSWYVQQFREGAIGVADLRAAIAGASDEVVAAFNFAECELNERVLVERLSLPDPEESPFYQCCAFSIFLDKREGTHWQHVVREEVAKWCAAYDDAGQSSWKFPWQGEGLYAGWKASAVLDRNAEYEGIRNFRAQVAQLPSDADTAIQEAIEVLQVPAEHMDNFLYQLLLTLPGWAGHLRYKDRELELRGSEGSLLHELLAILLNYERILYSNYAGDTDRMLGWQRTLLEDASNLEIPALDLDLAERLIWQAALEHVFESQLSAGIRPKPVASDRPDVQAVFCIDVRSEVFRRALESTDLSVQTLGFAGFFGVPIEHKVPEFGKTQARCPVLLAPPLKTAERAGDLNVVQMDTFTFSCIDERETLRAKKRYKEGAASCFTFVETMGLGYLAKLLKDGFGFGKSPAKPTEALPGFLELPDLESATDLAQGILRGLGLNQCFAKVVLLCGHGSETCNNPYASGLDCGACGGHAGDANARVAASLLNRVDIRAALAERGVVIPADTCFIGGLHNTTTDAVTLFDTQAADTSVVTELEAALAEAGSRAALERSVKLQLSGASKDILAAVKERGQDWSQVRPEWGLAGNAAFIVAPRNWTAAADLQGRAFLHDYDAAQDPEGALLEQIIGGPLVVTTWINLQYYASATDNAHFGSGHKSIHNVVGGVGVALGNESDLRPGLAWQSVHDGDQLVHQPLRLHACIATEPEVLDQILARQQHVRELVENGWVHLIALGKDGRLWSRRGASAGSWGNPTPVDAK